MKPFHKVLCMIISLVLCFSSLAVVPFAEENGPANGKYWRVGEESNGAYYSTLQEALNADSTVNNATIYLLGDGYSWSRTELLGKNVVIDCQGYTTGGVIEIRDTKKKPAGSVTVKNMKHIADASDGRTSQLGEASMITFENCSFTTSLKPQYGMFIVGTNLTMNNCTLTAEAADGAFPMVRPLNASPTININGCTMEHKGNGAVLANFTAKTKLNITDSKLICNKQGWVINCAANANITIDGDSEIISNTTIVQSRPAILLTAGTITVNGGTYTCSKSPVIRVKGATGVINSGTFIQKEPTQPVFYTDTRANIQLEPGIVLNGGNMICQVEATGETSIRYPEGVEMPYTLPSPDEAAAENGKVCRIGNTDDGVYYDRLSDAVNAAPDNGTLTRIILIVNLSLTDVENLNIANKNIVVDGQEKTITGTLGITGDGMLTVQNAKLTGGDAFTALVTLTGGNVTFEQCEITVENGSAFAVEQAASLTLQNTAVNGTATESALIKLSANGGVLLVAENTVLTAAGEVVHVAQGTLNVYSGATLHTVNGSVAVSADSSATVNYLGGTTKSDSVADGSVLIRAEEDAKVNVFYGTFIGAKALSNVTGLSYAEGTNEVIFRSETEGSSLRAVVNSFGIRFTSTASATLIANAEAMKAAGTIKGYTVGTLICNSAKLGDTPFTIEALTAANIHFKNIEASSAGSVKNADGSITFNAALVNVKMANSKLNFAAISYVAYILADDTVIYVYGEFDAEKNVNSMENLCKNGLLNVQQTKTTIDGVAYYHAVSEVYEVSEITGSLKKVKGNAYSCYSEKQLAKMKNYI